MIDKEKSLTHAGIMILVQRTLMFDEHMREVVGIHGLSDGIHGDIVFRVHPDTEFDLVFMPPDEAARPFGNGSEVHHRQGKTEHARCVLQIKADKADSGVVQMLSCHNGSTVQLFRRRVKPFCPQLLTEE